MFRPRTDERSRGSASFEAILVFPVVMAVFVLLFDFSAAVIQKARAQVAVREIAFRHLIKAPARRWWQSDEVVQEVWPEVRDDIQRPGWTSYAFEAESRSRGFRDLTGEHTSGNKNDVTVKPGDEGDPVGFATLANGLIATLSGQRDFDVSLETDYPFQTILPSTPVKATLKLDSSPWTKHELPCGYLGLLMKALNLPGGDGRVDISSWLGCPE